MRTDSQQHEEDGRNEDVSGLDLLAAIADADTEGTRSTRSPLHANIVGEATMNLNPKGNSAENGVAVTNSNLFLSPTSSATDKVNNYMTDAVAPGYPKRKIVDGSCEVNIRKRTLNTSKVTNCEGQSSSLDHTKAQKAVGRKAVSTPACDEVVIHSKTSGTCLDLDGWDATKSIAHVSRITQNVQQAVQQYVENAAKVFDSSSLPLVPKQLDQNTEALLQPPEESACPDVKRAFKLFMVDFKNLQKLANAENFNQHIFVEELSNKLYVWEKYMAGDFTEGIKKMVMKLSALMKELDSESGQQLQHMMGVLSD